MPSANDKILQYLEEAHGIESMLVSTLTAHIAMTPRSEYRDLLERHRYETRTQAQRIQARMGELGQRRSILHLAYGAAQTAVGQATSLALAPLQLLRGTGGEEKLLKNARDECATEALEIATYDALAALAEIVGDERTAVLAREHRTQEEIFLKDLRAIIPALTQAVVDAELKGDPSYDVTKTGAADAVRKAGQEAADAGRAVQHETEEAAGQAAAAGRAAASDVAGAAAGVASAATGAVAEVADDVEDAASGVARAASDVAGAATDAVSDVAATASGATAQVASDVADTTAKAAGEVADAAADATADVAATTSSAVAKAADEVQDAATDAAATTRRTSRFAREQVARAPGAGEVAGQARGATAGPDELPIENYDRLTVEQILPKLRTLSAEELAAVDGYERGGRGRKRVLDRTAALRSRRTEEELARM
jgi:ferritin-like metal-binding protein YciE